MGLEYFIFFLLGSIVAIVINNIDHKLGNRISFAHTVQTLLLTVIMLMVAYFRPA